MKFTILSHAGMLVEAGGVKLMIDPWIVGSCYWRSWWNYPKPAAIAKCVTDLDYIYITHLHWDHFHGVSLRKLPKSATVLIPHAHFGRMREDMEYFGFEKIIELPHGKPMSLSDQVCITSYQYGLAMDTALVITDGKITLLNMNDSKVSGRPLNQILNRHRKVDFLFRSHSSASVYPYCVETEDRAGLHYRSKEDYLREFVDTTKLVQPRYAIPFASNHCFLHRETYRYNATVVSPVEVQQYFAAHRPNGSTCEVMIPGDSWSDQGGFQLHEHDFFSNRDLHLARYAEEMSPVLDTYYQEEDSVQLPFSVFREYFEKFMSGLPRFGRIFFRPVVVFNLSTQPETYWILDFDKSLIYEQQTLPPAYAFRMKVHPSVLRDCLQKQMFSTFTASKRLSVEIRKGGVKDFLIFIQSLDLYEYQYFPLRRMLTKRFIKTWLWRWREILQYFTRLSAVFWRYIRGADAISAFVPKVSSD